mmetsp:Transcript_535/g.862  ORF Transcript_535/g.862 Transcript_535/m.862 type:complete len:142 (-) Transcript_535:747-1172(-)
MDESLVSPLRLTNSKHLLRNATAGSSGTASGSASGTSAGSGSNTTATAPSSLASTLASGSEHVSASQGQGLSNSSNSNSPARLSEVRLDQDLGLPKSPLPLWDLMHPPLDTLPQVGLMPMILNQVRPIPPRATVVITWIMS